MSTQMLCGDEVQSAVVDIGTLFSKFGDGGQELPRHVFRSDVGKIAIDDSLLTSQSSKYVVGDTSLRYHNKINSNVEISKPFENGRLIIASYLIYELDLFLLLIFTSYSVVVDYAFSFCFLSSFDLHA